MSSSSEGSSEGSVESLSTCGAYETELVVSRALLSVYALAVPTEKNESAGFRKGLGGNIVAVKGAFYDEKNGSNRSRRPSVGPLPVTQGGAGFVRCVLYRCPRQDRDGDWAGIGAENQEPVSQHRTDHGRLSFLVYP